MTTPPLDPVRGAEVAERLRALGVKGVLIKAAELGYITEVTCGMPKCFCPEELGGASHFVARTQTWNDSEPTHEHFPIPKREGGKATPDNTVLAHRLCNKLDFSISHGLPIEKLLGRSKAVRYFRDGGLPSFAISFTSPRPLLVARAVHVRPPRRPSPVPARTAASSSRR